MLREALRSSEQDGDVEEETQDADQQHWRRLLRAKAEARARYNQGRRLVGQRDACWPAPGPAVTSWQYNLLQRWDSGELRRELNEAVAACGHRPLGSRQGEHLDIGDSTGGGSRRLVDGWVPPGWREFFSHSDTA